MFQEDEFNAQELEVQPYEAHSQELLNQLFDLRINQYHNGYCQPSRDIHIQMPETSAFLNLTFELKTLKEEVDFHKKELLSIEKEKKKVHEIGDTMIKNISSISSLTENNSESIEILTEYTEFLSKTRTYLEKVNRKLVATESRILNSIQERENKINDIHTVISGFVDEVKKQQNVNTISPNSCSICLTNTVKRVLVPCGHTFCDECIVSNSRRTSSCPTCRSGVSQIIKVFI